MNDGILLNFNLAMLNGNTVGMLVNQSKTT